MVKELDTDSMARVCQTCGHVGYKELLLCCNKCRISVEHRYCLAKIPPADDDGLTYICALCVSSSANQTSEQYVLRPSRRRKHRRQRIDQPAACVQDLKETAASRTSIAEVEAKEPTCDPSSSLLTSKSDPVVEDAIYIQNLENIPTKGETVNLHTSAAEPLVKDVLPQPEPKENNRSPPRIDQPTEFLQDLTRWRQVKGEAEPQRCNIPTNLQASVSECRTSLSKPSVNHMLPQADLNGSNRSPSIDQPAMLVQNFKKRLAKGEAKQQTCEVPHCLQTSVLHLEKDVLPQAGENGRCPSRIDRPAKGDLKLQTCDVPPYLQTPVSEISAKDVAPQARLNGNNRMLYKLDQPAALVHGLKKRQADSSTLANVVAEFQTCDVSPSVRTSSCNPFVKDVLTDAGMKEKSSSMQLHAENRYRDQEVNGKRRRTSHDDWDKPDVVDGDVEGQQLQVVPVAPVDTVISQIPLQITSTQPVGEHTNYVRAQPYFDPAWRGCFEICGKKFGPFVAHLSNKACLRVVEAAKVLPVVLCAKIMPRLETWPESFNASAPTDENIALYFFPGNDSVVKAFDGLVNRIIKRDLALKVLLDTAELLILSSNQLPVPYWRFFNGKYYVWGVFRRRNDSVSHELGDGRIEQHSSTSTESLEMSPLSPLSMSGSYSSESPRSPVNNNTLSSKSCTLKLVSASNTAK